MLWPWSYVASNPGSLNITEYVSFNILLIENGLPVRRKNNDSDRFFPQKINV